MEKGTNDQTKWLAYIIGWLIGSCSCIKRRMSQLF